MNIYYKFSQWFDKLLVELLLLLAGEALEDTAAVFAVGSLANQEREGISTRRLHAKSSLISNILHKYSLRMFALKKIHVSALK